MSDALWKQFVEKGFTIDYIMHWKYLGGITFSSSKMIHEHSVHRKLGRVRESHKPDVFFHIHCQTTVTKSDDRRTTSNGEMGYVVFQLLFLDSHLWKLY